MLFTATVETNTLVLLRQLQKIKEFSKLRLVGGTALSLQLGHRKSIDLDFFGEINLTGHEIIEILKNQGINNIILDSEAKNIHLFKINDIKVDFVNYPFEWLEQKIEIDGIIMAHQKDIAAMKLEAITNRGSKKDFIDLYFLLEKYKLSEILEFYLNKFPHGSVYNVLRSLTYFNDAEDQVSPVMLKSLDWEKLKSTIKEKVIKI